ncbi:macrophage mannose receptor 1-like, partial [Engraulis encrasicolus]|uniref:macrophage mannose receptor 1-like n=1 Tax=Engraulis encrasicolus TaxID=184585 RepID=UPI002FCF7556
IYTVQGNAFGSPCHFPFHYQDRWYSDCKLEEPTQRYWCSVDRDYNDKWGYCPTTRSQPLESEGWKKNLLIGVYYQVNVNSALTWHQARMSCQQQDSDLLSITEPQEQTFISGITNELQTTLWIGLNQLNSESGWQWVDGNPFSYLRWGSGQPNPAPGWSCASLITAQNYEWQNKLCSRRHGYICQKRTTISATATPAPPVACNAPWISYAGHCYFLNRTKNTWKDANAQCIAGGGHLASIHNIEEQSFVLSQLGYRETDKLWIGLNDKKTQLLFEWSDHSRVMFTAWDVQEPSHHRSEEEDCVLMGGKDGKWGDASCEEQNGFICKKAGDSVSSSGMEHNNIGCKAGWTRHGYNCYFVGPTTKTFDEAKDSCQDSGAHLVDVPDRLENAFLISMVGARPEKHFWIGLNNQRNLSVFEWTNTPKVPYTHWNARMPGQKQGCVAMTTGTLAGLWDVLSCSNKEKYICKHQAEGVVTTPAPTTSPAPRCAVGWSPLGDRPFCFKFFEMPSREQRSWSEALEYCRSIGGDLMSVHSDAEGELRTRARIPPFFPWYRELDHWHGEPDPWHMPPRYWLQREGWIGYSAQDPTVGYTWSDGSSVS